MYSDTIILQHPDGSTRPARRLPLGETQGRNEQWLRDLLFRAPEIIPVDDLDPSFGPLVPLCRELRTEAGPVDVAYINKDGLLTLVECKLWRNPEARRKVVAQVLDYARTVAKWSYADLQRQVSIAVGTTGNVPYALVKATTPDLEEHRFVDAVSRAMRSGRFQLLVAGDGIREDVSAIADLVNRNAASAFSFSMIEIALYSFGDILAVQPRAIARTVTLERTVVVIRDGNEQLDVTDVVAGNGLDNQGSSARAERATWWAPLEGLTFDDPEQEPARFSWPNNLYTPLPFPGVWLQAYRSKEKGGECGVFLGGRSEPLREVTRRLIEDNVLTDLPRGTVEGGTVEGANKQGLQIRRPESEFENVEKEHRWLAETLNAFVNALRPRLKKHRNTD